MKEAMPECQRPIYRVVVNHEQQLSISPGRQPIPEGWRPEGMVGYRQECLNYIEQIRMNIGALSLRRLLEARGTLQ